jgi:hypothetical protein
MDVLGCVTLESFLFHQSNVAIGMANRLAFDIGLHLDCRSEAITDQEIQIRHMVMRACVIYDKYWALFLGRPTSIKSQDIGMDLLSTRFSQLSSSLQGSSAAEEKKSSTEEIYEQLIELMELAGKIVETRDSEKGPSHRDQANFFAVSEAEDNAYLHVINLDRQLQNWYRRLPEHLAWKPANIKMAPFSFFLLHQQYHVSMILLHRPWAKYGAISDGESTGSHPSPESTHQPRDVPEHHLYSSAGHSLGLDDPNSLVDDSRTSLSRNICTQQAIRVARIFWQHRQRFDGRKICVTGIQHAGTAAIALIAALAYQRNEADRRTYLGYLEILGGAVSDMSHTYHPAARMDDLLMAVLGQLRNDIGDLTGVGSGLAPPSNGTVGSYKSILSELGWQPNIEGPYPSIASRREATELDGGQAFKRRRPGNSRRASEISRPPRRIFLAQTQPTPPKSSYGQHSYDEHTPMQMSSSMFSHTAGDREHSSFSLDFISGAVDVEERSEGMGCAADDFVIVTPSSKNWAFGHANLSSGFDLPVAEWISGPAGLSATTVLGSAGTMPIGISDEISASNAGGETISGSQVNVGSMRKGDGKKGEESGVEWVGAEGGIDTLSPVSLSGLVKNAEKVAGADPESMGIAPRNHELDFFSF